MFRGFCKSKIDGKGRVTVPNRYRGALDGDEQEIIITGHPAGCLMMYKLDDFLAVEKRIAALPDLDDYALYMKQVIVGYADQMRLDSYGRALIGAQLREHAKLGKEALLMGMTNHVRLWDEGIWKGISRKAKEKSANTVPAGWDGFTY